MASTPDEKTVPVLSLTTADITSPPKALTPFDTPSATPVRAEKVIELRRDSGPSTPRSSCRHDNPFDTDVEAMITTTTSTSGDPLGPRKTAVTVTKQDCPTVWPSAQQWKAQAKDAKKTRYSCNCMAGLSKRNRILVKVLIILLIVGIGLGVGFGVSRTLNAPIWGDKQTQQ